MYRTAIATIGCAAFPAGSHVSVKYSHHGDNGIAWFTITEAADAWRSGILGSPVIYPEHHAEQMARA